MHPTIQRTPPYPILLATLLACSAPACTPTAGGGTMPDTVGSSGPPGETFGTSADGTDGATEGSGTTGANGTAGTSESGGGTGSGSGATTGDTGGMLPPCRPDPQIESDPFADCVARFEPADGVSFGHDALPDVVLGPPVGGGAAGGGMDVASLGCGGRIVLAFDGEGIVDGPGPDFIVFENPFVIGEGPETFTEPGEVAVSADGRTFHTFPCTPSGDGTFPPEGCAGVTPVFAGPDAPQIDPTDPTAAGGDAFDLADVGLSSARYVRIVDRTAEHYGDETWCGGAAGGFDLDAIASVHATEQP